MIDDTEVIALKIKRFAGVTIACVMGLTGLTGCDLLDTDKAGTSSGETIQPKTEPGESNTQTETQTEPGEIDTKSETPTEPIGPVTDPVEFDYGMAFYSNGGRIIHHGGYTYFVQAGLLNDGSENGQAYSENIYRISDAQDAAAELVSYVPSYMADGVDQTTVFYMMGYEDRLYFVRRGCYGNLYICSMDLNTGAIKDLEELPGDNTSVVACDGEMAIIVCKVYTESDDKYSFFEFDMASGELREFDPQYPKADDCFNMIYGLSGSRIYYAQIPDTSEDKGYIFSCDYSGEDVVEYGSVRLDTRNMICLDDYFIYSMEDELFVKDALTGKELITVDEYRDKLDSFYIYNGKLWYIDGKKLGTIDLTTGEDKILFDDTRYSFYLGFGDGWVFISDDSGFDTRRVRPDATKAPDDYLADEGIYEDKKEGDWIYREYPNFTMIVGYEGEASVAEVPKEINGRQVLGVSLWIYKNKSLKTLTIPEGVISIYNVECRTVTTLNIPASLRLMTMRGFKNTINLAEGATINFAGTKAQWQEIEDISTSLYGDVSTDTSGTAGATVLCSDGSWGIHVTVDANGNAQERVLCTKATLAEALREAKSVSVNTRYEGDKVVSYIYRVGVTVPDSAAGQYWSVYVNDKLVPDGTYDDRAVNDGDVIRVVIEGK